MYTPEVGISLKTLLKDMEHLKTRYRLDVKGKSEGRLVLRCVSSLFLSLDLTLSSFIETRKPLQSTPPTCSLKS